MWFSLRVSRVRSGVCGSFWSGSSLPKGVALPPSPPTLGSRPPLPLLHGPASPLAVAPVQGGSWVKI
eukprot:2843132-Pyramimonas_sp.AAC.1